MRGRRLSSHAQASAHPPHRRPHVGLLRAPHSESDQLAEAGFDEWAASLPAEDAADLVDVNAGKPVRWVPGEGWVESNE